VSVTGRLLSSAVFAVKPSRKASGPTYCSTRDDGDVVGDGGRRIERDLDVPGVERGFVEPHADEQVDPGGFGHGPEGRVKSSSVSVPARRASRW
jgi:hypothetical protein